MGSLIRVAYLNPALSQYRAEVNVEYPNRDKASDGTIADGNHAAWSQHQPDPPPKEEIDAWDMDDQLNGADKPAPASDIERLKVLFQRHPSSHRWIYKRLTATRANSWWVEPYTGENPHDKHVHWETRESHDEVTSPFGVSMSLTGTQDQRIHAINERMRALAFGLDTIQTTWTKTVAAEPQWLVARVQDISIALAELVDLVQNQTPGGLTADQVRVVVREELDKTRLGP
jgi:hypothetical protein